ncbi:DDE-type integrase/transposase/recombinase [Streptomyces sp. TRM66268-LWL]|uniref:DDE-type integrase/transposase/recombinase n=1 Tax=Streptomyces polyasparticus TaxID=2767826 RepID=A0ABR7SB65_9ACTN|nr:DDE-type integrase/transposase/recombinase [Streptomyces polyasparticus]
MLVLKLARQPYYRWVRSPVTDAELAEAYRANALFDAHRDDPEFGHRFLLDEACVAGEAMAERTAWRICRGNGWWSAFGKRRGRGKNAKAGPPVHDNKVRRNFTATAPNRLWLTGITEHSTGAGKLCLCAIKDVFPGRIVGYSIDSRMKSRLVVTALQSAVDRRGQVDGCIVHSDRGSRIADRGSRIAISVPEIRLRPDPKRPGRLDGPGRCSRRQRGHGELLRAAAEERPGPSSPVRPTGIAERDRDLDRTHLPPPPTPDPIDPRRVRDHHDPTRSTRSMHPAVT